MFYLQTVVPPRAVRRWIWLSAIWIWHGRVANSHLLSFKTLCQTLAKHDKNGFKSFSDALGDTKTVLTYTFDFPKSTTWAVWSASWQDCAAITEVESEQKWLLLSHLGLWLIAEVTGSGAEHSHIPSTIAYAVLSSSLVVGDCKAVCKNVWELSQPAAAVDQTKLIYVIWTTPMATTCRVQYNHAAPSSPTDSIVTSQEFDKQTSKQANKQTNKPWREDSQNCNVWSTQRLKELQTGRPRTQTCKFDVKW